MEINLFYAAHRHKMWLLYLKAYLLDIQEISEAFVNETCYFEYWLNNYGLKAYSHLHELQEAEQAHNNFHNTVKNILRLKTENLINEAWEEIKILEKRLSVVSNSFSMLELRIIQDEN